MTHSREPIRDDWWDFLSAIEAYAFGRGQDALDFLEGLRTEEPWIVTADEILAAAQKYDFDLPLAVRSLRNHRDKEDREGLPHDSPW